MGAYTHSESLFFLQETSTFFKKRALLEEEYGRNLQKLAKSTAETYGLNDAKAGYVSSFLTCLRIEI